jgi:Tfp pilus assembly protein PilX
MKQDEKGIALVITLFLMATLSALAVSMMFLAQTETASSRNYRTMSQARYAAEAGVHEMANYLMYTWVAPVAPYTNYDATRVPVTCTGGCSNLVGASGTCNGSTIANAVNSGCIVIGYSAATSNNPAGTINSGASGTLATNSSGTTSNGAMGTVTYNAAAVLMSIRQINVYGGQPASIATWQIISDGTVPPSTAAIVEVSSSLEQELGQAQAYAVFASSGTCGSITIAGAAVTDSYNSVTMVGSPPLTGSPLGAAGSVGGVGTNGNLNVSGSVTINGTLSTPRTGGGTCSNSSPDAITGSGNKWSYSGTNKLSQSVNYPTPTIPGSIPTTNITIQASDGSAVCQSKLVAALASGWTCTVSNIPVANTLTLTPTSTSISSMALGNVSVGSNTNLVIAAPVGAVGTTIETLNVNSFAIGSNATMSMATGTNVVMNIAGQHLTGTTLPLDLSGGGNVNTTYDPSRLQIIYPGTGQLKLVGNNSIAATVYAPNALVTTVGTGNMYGAVLGGTFQDLGGAQIHFDSALTKKFSTLGDYMLTSFSWKKY